MVYYLPVLGAVAIGAGTILERLVLKKKDISVKTYQTASFIAVVLAMLPFIYFFWRLDFQALQLNSLLIMGIVIVFSTIANLFLFYSLKWEKVSNLEPARILEPLFTIILAVIFSFFVEGLYDRNFHVVVPALIAGLALVFSHIKKHHLEFNKYFIAMVLGSLFFSLELVTSRLILDFYSPITFYFVRSFFVLVLSFVILRPKFTGLDTKVKWTIFITGSIWVLYRIIVYYGYQTIGVVFTTLIVMLGPVFTYLFARIFLKEKLEWRNIAAAAIIVMAVLYALFV
jgi:drug/metabolite transporter (DMT)-like permease